MLMEIELVTSHQRTRYVLPENIKSIKLLKSASELSIYGGEGRDGVVLIKTIN